MAREQIQINYGKLKEHSKLLTTMSESVERCMGAIEGAGQGLLHQVRRM